MTTYFRMKYLEWKLWKLFYGAVLGALNEREESWDILRETCAALKNTPADGFREAFISRLAETIHGNR